MLRGYRDRDYLQTLEEYFFCVIGPVHPTDRVISYLKYVPDPQGKWRQGRKSFRRALRYYTTLDLLETLRFLENHPEYLYDSPVMGIRMSAVSKNRIRSHFKPEEKLHDLSGLKETDLLQQKVVELARFISDMSDVPEACLGVTGSVLLDIHQSFSDMDLIVYGKANSQRVKETLNQTYREEKSPIRRFGAEEARRWCLDKTLRFPLTYNEASFILGQKWGRGLFNKTLFSMHPVKLEQEVDEKYGDRIFKPEGMVMIEAIVSDASEAIFLPSVYKVEDSKIVEGTCVEDVDEVVTYEGLFSDIIEEGEKLEAYGKLERVVDNKREIDYHRVLVGSKEAEGKDYIKPAYLS